MMYANKLAVALKVNGKVLREMKSEGSERDDTVRIPYGSEYAVFVKNMNSVRALVRIEIDGVSVTDGMSLIVDPNDDIEIERFIKNGNMSAGLRLKFIERTQKIEDGPRGIKAEDGLVRIEYEFEREPAKIVPSPMYQQWLSKHGSSTDQLARGYNAEGDLWNTKSILRSASLSSTSFGQASSTSMNDTSIVNASAASMDWMDAEQARSAKVQELNDKGITVGGSVSTQEFRQGAWFPTDGVKHIMIFKVLGAVGEKAVTKPVTVKTKVECSTCGTKNKFGTKFCGECGAGLVDL